ncbi:tRNA (N(6)-L-threonylcarbamoyladenosine(37)-C(2))-methylthiotransferase MtaB [Polaribacter sp. ALD11]|uniref:radical SAM protein n=1 Tax=Polaribacter sp. ALD11 TaxID=2058137 RepID=UPI000C3039EC|nr:radical SAM protein [Polaribacter sp. ALD11]AUC84906.1 tRNA (N(6)-L-threonylcarbamoyladenosine(37)-C(2))-methylthiotransferase MtaB [Polaribacter sp. ALD11]
MLSYKNKTLGSFKVGAIFAIIFSFLFILLWGVRFFQIDFLLIFLPETIREMFDKSPMWVFYGYLLTALANFVAAILLFRRNIVSVIVSQYAAAGMLMVILCHFFITDYIGLYEAVEMFVTLMFYLLLAWFSKNSRKNGYLSKISKEITTVSLKIQEGCSHECAYCLIPLLKGASRSDTLDNILSNAKDMADEGIKDIVLIGDNIGDFGKGEKGNLNHPHSFLDLLKKLDKIGGIHRFSFLSVTTPMFSDATLEFIKESIRFSPYFSIKMDSGSDTVLKNMNRPFPLSAYKDLFLNIKKIMPDAYIVVEIIVGFPGETDELFNESVNFLLEADISYIAPTMYSDKRGTKAFEIKDGSVSKNVRKKRKKVLVELSKKKLQAFYENQLGEEKMVLFENKRRGDYIYGYTDNRVKVKCAWNPELGNSLHMVKLIGVNRSFMLFDFMKDEISVEEGSYVKI